MDLKAFVAGKQVAIPGRGIGFTERPPRKPLISAVEGHALAGGTEVVLATDLVVASRTAKFGFPEVNRGLVAAGGGLLRLPRRIPYQKALEIALTGDSFTAEQGAAWGFVNVMTEPGEALAGAIDLAERITANGPLAVVTTKEILVKSASWSDDEMWKKQLDYIIPIFTSNDAKEVPSHSPRNALPTGRDPDGEGTAYRPWTSDSKPRRPWWSEAGAAWDVPLPTVWLTTVRALR
jgi:enoyl-CoA hydratase